MTAWLLYARRSDEDYDILNAYDSLTECIKDAMEEARYGCYVKIMERTYTDITKDALAGLVPESKMYMHFPKCDKCAHKRGIGCQYPEEKDSFDCVFFDSDEEGEE